jgi:hypothetical protein
MLALLDSDGYRLEIFLVLTTGGAFFATTVAISNDV